MCVRKNDRLVKFCIWKNLKAHFLLLNLYLKIIAGKTQNKNTEYCSEKTNYFEYCEPSLFKHKLLLAIDFVGTMAWRYAQVANPA